MAENKSADLSMDFAAAIRKLAEGIKGHYSLINQLERSATSFAEGNFISSVARTSFATPSQHRSFVSASGQ